jgi:hypothetical protein
MKPGKADLVRTCAVLLFLLATVPAYCQRGTLDLSVGETRDQFGPIAPVTGTVIDLTGELAVIKASAKTSRPAIVAGGEVRVPTDTQNHSREYAIYGGVAFGSHNLTIGVDGEVRKIIMPPAMLDNQVLNRYNFNLLEIPLVVKYKFGPDKRAFIHLLGEPEFTPHYKGNSLMTVPLPKPSFDHGYTFRGSVGYTFGQWWYVKGTYETRFFKFQQNLGNPSSLYNWKSNMITGGVGVQF